MLHVKGKDEYVLGVEEKIIEGWREYFTKLLNGSKREENVS